MSAFRSCARLLLVNLSLSVMSIPVSAGVFDSYAGTWRGTGKVTLKNGRHETLVCKIHSRTEVNGTRVYHKLKCKSDSENINVRINLSADKQKIYGNWSASGAVHGTIRGKAHGNSLDLQLSGLKSTIALKLAAFKCHQNMSLAGKIGNIRKISVRLNKGC